MTNELINDTIGKATSQEYVGKQLLVIYGKINQEVIVSAIRLTEQKLLLENVSISVITKAKIVCTEMLQNILKHQQQIHTQLPNFIVRLCNNSLSIISTNVISKENKNYISAQLDAYAKVTDFRAVYIKAFETSVITPEGNAGLGLIDIVYRAKQNFTYSMEQLSPNSFAFNLTVIIPQTVIIAN